MTDWDDELKRRYREAAREEPSSALDAAILAKARAKAETRDAPSFPASAEKEGASLVSGSFRRWSVPLSLAAVLMLGIGVSLRMQLEQPGIETSMPATEYSKSAAPPAQQATPAPQVPPPAAADSAAAEAAPAPEARAKRIEAPKPLARAAPAPQPAPLARDQATTAAPEPAPLKERAESASRADAFVPSPRPQESREAASAPPPPPATANRPFAAPPPPAGMASPAAPAPAVAPLRAKRERENDAAGERSLQKSWARDPMVELERIARLRESGQHAEADKALEEFRKLQPGYRIPEAMWERVRPR